MGCGGQYAKSSNSALVGPSIVEVRYSKVCKAAWARITRRGHGRRAARSARAARTRATRSARRTTPTPRWSPSDVRAEARACATLVAGSRAARRAPRKACPRVHGPATGGTRPRASRPPASGREPAPPGAPPPRPRAAVAPRRTSRRLRRAGRRIAWRMGLLTSERLPTRRYPAPGEGPPTASCLRRTP